MSARVAIVTCSGRPDAIEADAPLVEACRAAGLDTAMPDWRDRSVDWARFDASVVRTTWDYQYHAEAFHRWIDHAARQTRLLNPPAILRWGFDKRHLMALAAAGAAVIPTLFPSNAAVEPVLRWASACGWTRLVLKPVLGAGGIDTVVMDATAEGVAGGWARVSARHEGYLVQPFLPAVLEQGEISVILYGGEIQHSILKRAASGEFRVQAAHGGTVERVETPDEAARLALLCHAALPADPLFLRVDLIGEGDRYQIIECEVVEPELFFPFAAGSAERLAHRIAALTRGEP